MFRKVLVGVDDSPAATDAVWLAQQLVSANGAVILAHVHGGYPLRSQAWDLRRVLESEHRANELLAGLSARTGVTEVIAIGAPSAGRGLHQLAVRLHADLLVVGSTRIGGVGRVLLGDDTREATNGSPCAVAIAPLGYGEGYHAVSQIGVAYNGTRESRHALVVGRVLAARFGATLSACEAVDTSGALHHGLTMPAGEITEAMVAHARRRLSQLNAVEPHVVHGDPAQALATFSESVDLLIVGARDFGPLGRLFYSSLSGQLSRSARCPLLILTRAVRDAVDADEEPSIPDTEAAEIASALPQDI